MRFHNRVNIMRFISNNRKGDTMTNLKVAVIGGGSSYTPELLEGMITNQKALGIKEVWLVDVESGKEKLQIMEKLCKRMVEKANSSIDINATLIEGKQLEMRITLLLKLE